jgi:universal stress protein E
MDESTEQLFANIVVGVDVSSDTRLVSPHDIRPRSVTALASAARIAERNGAHLHILTNLEVDPHAEQMIQRDREAGRDNVLDLAAKALEEQAAPLRESGIDVTTSVAFGHPATAILADVRDNGRDLVVIGTRERGPIARNFLGSTSLRLIRKAKPPVVVARKGPHDTWSHILCPVDFSDITPHLLRIASRAARAYETKLTVAHVVDYSGERVMAMGGPIPQDLLAAYREERQRSARAELDTLVAAHVAAGVETEIELLDGDPADAILERAEQLETDLVVMGAVSHGALRGLLVGSVADAVLPYLNTSLVVMKPVSFSWALKD